MPVARDRRRVELRHGRRGRNRLRRVRRRVGGTHPRDEVTRKLTARAARMLGHAVGGLGFGYLILHPVSMVIFRLLAPDLPHWAAGDDHPIIGPVLLAFRPEMLPMGGVFALFSAAIAAGNGYLRGTLAMQESELRRRSELLARKNRRLVDLEQASRRTARYMAHDFKTHLSCVIGYADLLLAREEVREDPMKRVPLQAILRQALKMLDAVREMLDFARLRENAGVAPVETCAREILAQASEQEHVLGRGEPVEVGRGAGGCPPVLADNRLIARVMANLISNAVRHNSEPVSILLDAEVLADGKFVLFSCSDDGRGIDDRVRVRLFEEFAGSADREGSTGLGLAFCREAVRAHGGRIWAEHRDGTGARFCFTLRVAEEEEREDCTMAGEVRSRR